MSREIGAPMEYLLAVRAHEAHLVSDEVGLSSQLQVVSLFYNLDEGLLFAVGHSVVT